MWWPVRLFGLVVVIGSGAVAWLALSHAAMPVSELGSAYTLGVRTGLSSEHVHALWRGQTPEIRFRRRQYDMSNRYIWQRATLRRVGNCLDLAPDPQTGRPAPPPRCRLRDATERNGNHLLYSVTPQDEIDIGVSDKPPSGDRRIADGALFEVDGQIAAGASFDGASVFAVRVDAPGLYIAEPSRQANPNVEPEDDSACTEPAWLRMRSPGPLWLVPSTLSRLCRFTARNGRTLYLVQFQSGPLQRAAWLDRLACRALLRELVAAPTPGDFAGCLGGVWGGLDRTDLALSLFEITAAGDFARLQ